MGLLQFEDGDMVKCDGQRPDMPGYTQTAKANIASMNGGARDDL